MLQCGYCGSTLTRRVKYNSRSNPQMRVWQCVTATKDGKEKCNHSLAVDEELLKKAFLESINALIDQDDSQQMKEFLETVENIVLSSSPAKKITDLEAKISNLEKQKDNIVELRVSGIVSKEDCEKKYASIAKEIEMVKGELDRYKDKKREQSEVKGSSRLSRRPSSGTGESMSSKGRYSRRPSTRSSSEALTPMAIPTRTD